MAADVTKGRVPDIVVAAVVVAVIAAMVFSPALFGPFIYDDKPLIVGNTSIRSLSSWRSWFTRDFWYVNTEFAEQVTRLRYYRPLVTASYALEYALAGLDPLLYHATNLVAHAVACVLALFTLRRWGGSLAGAVVATALFAIHPTKAESVAWISGRTDVLCAIWVLAASYGASRRLRGERGGLAIELMFTALAYGTKEGAVALVAFVGVEAWVAQGRPPLARAELRRVVVAVLPQAAIAVAYLAARALWMPIRPTKPAIGAYDHFVFFFETLGAYVSLAAAPHDLSTQRALLRTSNGAFVHEWSLVVTGAVATLLFAVIAWRQRRTNPIVSVAIAFWFVTILPISNLVLSGISTLYAERFLYVPLLGPCAAVALMVGRVDAARRRTAFVLAGALLLVYAVTSVRRALDFTDDTKFWAHERALHPEALEPRRVELSRALSDRRYERAFRLAIEGRDVAARWYAHNGSEIEFVHKLVEARVLATPDLARADLAAYERFFRDLTRPEPVVAELQTHVITLKVPNQGALRDRLLRLRPQSFSIAADVASRLGDDAGARASCASATSACPSCVGVALTCSRILARAGDYEGAYAMMNAIDKARAGGEVETLDRSLHEAELARKQADVAPEGPLQLTLRATELSRLDAWGRAYALLAPHRAQIERAPGFALSFAELAFRAGDAGVAREVLATILPEEKREPELEKWAYKMGWR